MRLFTCGQAPEREEDEAVRPQTWPLKSQNFLQVYVRQNSQKREIPGRGSVPGWAAKIPQVVSHSPHLKNKQKKQQKKNNHRIGTGGKDLN